LKQPLELTHRTKNEKTTVFVVYLSTSLHLSGKIPFLRGIKRQVSSRGAEAQRNSQGWIGNSDATARQAPSGKEMDPD
jgi:hypothetical protein